MPLDPFAPPLIDCRPLRTFAPDDLASVRASFGDATPIPLRQAWRDAPEQDFAPAVVRTGWREDALLVFAELWDADVFTRAQRHNERFWELGDTFEMFLQPPGGANYVELHVAPNNLRLQLRFAEPPSSAASDADPFTAALILGNLFDSHTWVNADLRQWCVFAEIPTVSVFGAVAPADRSTPPLAESTWPFSFCRYDATRGRAQPVISSTSPHTLPAFHRPHEWGVLRFAF